MQKVIVQTDWYTKAILTLIAVLLAGLLAKPYVVSKPVSAISLAPDMWVGISEKDVIGNIPVEVQNWPSAGTLSVSIKDIKPNYLGKVDASISGWSTITVVDWKEREDYEKYLREKRSK